ncbi:TPA: WxL domain-containing protein [Enterococcus faecalis]|nr:WxL domain-containing protein [Enterococcus faecalis]
MGKFKISSLIFLFSVTSFSSACLAEEKEKSIEQIENTLISSLGTDNMNLSKLSKLYPEINVTKLTNEIKLSDKEQVVVEQVKEFIDTNSYENVINVFSDSLYDVVPINDQHEGQKYDITDLKEVYENKIKKESETYAKLLVSVNELEKYDQDTVKQQLVLISYFTRWGNFSNGKHMFWYELYHPRSDFMTKEQTKQLNDAFIQLFSENPKQYLASKNVNKTFELVGKSIELNYSYKQFVERFLIQNGITERSKWFYETFKGTVYKDHYEGTEYDVGIWNRSNTFNNFLPYLLNQTETSNLMIGETRGEIIFLSPYVYKNDLAEAEKVLIKAMKVITNTLELYDRTIEDKELINVDKVMGQRAILDQGRNWLDPEDSLSYELYRVAGYDGSHPNNGAIGGGGQIKMLSQLLSDDATLAHELGHELNTLFKADGEFYTTYISANTGNHHTATLNTFADGEIATIKKDSIANKSTLQMQSKEDLVNYAKNMEDMVYVLDGVIATKVLELPVEEQAKYIKIANVDGENGSLFEEKPGTASTDVKDLTVEELKKLNIKTIDDLIDNNAVIMEPTDENKNILRNTGQGYGTTLTYSAFFLINGKPTHHNHRIINTMFAEGGWETFKTFNLAYNEANSQLKDPNLSQDERMAIASSAALKKVYDDENITYRELVRKRYTESIERAKKEGVMGGSYKSLVEDLSTGELANFYNYKYQLMFRYLTLSNDFSSSAFGDYDNFNKSVGSYTELYEAIEENPTVNIDLSQNFEVHGKYAEKELPTFLGTLNGNGYTISKSNHPLFKNINKAKVKNLILADADIRDETEMQVGGLARLVTDSTIENVHVIESQINTSNINDKVITGGLVGESINTNIFESTVQDTVMSGSYVGGIAGIAKNSRIINVYSTGNLRNLISGDLRIGGIIGNGFDNTEVKNSYTTMNVVQGNGILGSDYSYGYKRIKIENSISLAKIETANKAKFYDYGVSLAPWKNNFEVEEYTGKSSTTFENLDVSSISLDQINQDFFANQLSWKNESIWGIENTTSEKELPYLKNSDPRNKEEKDLSKLTLKTERKEIYVGEELDLADLIDEVYDTTGQLADKKEVEIIGTVDNSKPGETVIVYKYNNIEKKATIVVKENKTSVKVHDSIIYVGDTWEAKDNFDSAIDKDGQSVAFEKITVGGETVDTTKAGRYEVLYSYEDIESKAVVTVKESQTTAFEKETKITFLEDNDTGTIVDPDNPDGGVNPVDPINPNGAELMISYASNLNFGLHKSKTGTSFNALADKVWVDESRTETKEVTPFVATKDSRGASRKGWVLTARQENAFIGENQQPLKGAELSLSNLAYSDLVGAPTATTNKIVLNEEAKEVAKAGINQGVGAWSLAMGQLDGSIEQGEDKVMNKTTSGITLSLPANTVIDTQTYSTTITWELATDPTL